MMGTATPSRSSPSTIAGTAAADSSLLTVTRTSSLPARGQRGHLAHRRGHVGRVGVGHRLDHDRVAGADRHTADRGGDGLPAGEGGMGGI